MKSPKLREKLEADAAQERERLLQELREKEEAEQRLAADRVRLSTEVKQQASLAKSIQADRERLERERGEEMERIRAELEQRAEQSRSNAAAAIRASEDATAQEWAAWASRESELAGEHDRLRNELAVQQEAMDAIRREQEERASTLRAELDALRAGLEKKEAAFEKERERILRAAEAVRTQLGRELGINEDDRTKTVAELADEEAVVMAAAHSAGALEMEAELPDDESPTRDTAASTIPVGEELDDPDGPETVEDIPLSLPLLCGWFCLLAGTTVLLVRPSAYSIGGPPLGLAFLLGWFIALRRRSPLVYGLILLSLIVPASLMAAVHFAGFQGVLIQTPLVDPAAEDPLSIPPQPGDEERSIDALLSDSDATPQSAIRIGESVVVDGIRVTFNGVRRDHIVITDLMGDMKIPDQWYLIVDVTLQNVTEGSRFYIENPWEKARLVDNLDHSDYVITEQRLGLDHIEGSPGSFELDTGAEATDLLVFGLPSGSATSFTVISDPGFLSISPLGMHRPISRDPLRIRFSRSDIRSPAPAAEGGASYF